MYVQYEPDTMTRRLLHVLLVRPFGIRKQHLQVALVSIRFTGDTTWIMGLRDRTQPPAHVHVR